jgi:SAM-dependent methyltransferase
MAGERRRSDMNSAVSQYALGNTDAEHARLMRQAEWLAPHTARLFREAGIGTGHRVVDLGCGVGDVSLIAAQLVGPSGAVIGVERDPRSVERARARMRDRGLNQVRILQSDVGKVAIDQPFDAAVGRYILMFLADPSAVLRSTARLVRPGGVAAFQEPDWTSFLEEVAAMPLWSAAADLLVTTLQRCGTNTDMGNALPRVFREADLPAPTLRTDRLIGAESWLPDCLCSMRDTMAGLGLSLEPLGELDTLCARLSSEVSAFKKSTPLPSIVSAWSRVARVSPHRSRGTHSAADKHPNRGHREH